MPTKNPPDWRGFPCLTLIDLPMQVCAGRTEMGLIRKDHSGGTRAFQYCWNCSDQDFEVEPKGPCVDILQIKLHPPVEGNRASAFDLP
jgi:hypothetical protein